MNDISPNALDEIGDICTKMLLSYDIFAKNNHIGGNELAIFYTLWADGECTQKHIADKCMLAKQTVNTLCKKYEAEGVLTARTGETDKREKVLAFTESGRMLAGGIIKPLLQIENAVIDEFGGRRMAFLLAEFQELQRLLSEKLEQK